MKNEITIQSNGSPTGNEFLSLFMQQMMVYKKAQQKWISNLRELKIVAARPDDGWVDRNLNIVTFTYPDFNDGATIGSVIALGNHQQYRLVRLIKEMTHPLSLTDAKKYKLIAIRKAD